MLEIAQQMQEEAEGDAHAGRLIDDARCLCAGLVHRIDELWEYLKELECEAERDQERSRISISGTKAANLFGLSIQVPMQNVFWTEAPSRTVRIGNRTVTLNRTS
jgi:hypothetical protein